MPDDFSMADLAKAMDKATDDVKREMAGLVDLAAQAMLNRVQERWPAGPTGNLRSMVTISQPKQFSVTSTGLPVMAKRVRATAPHLWMWQNGTVQRHDSTRKNANRGRMPVGGPVFETAASEIRANMLRRAQDLLDRRREL